MTQMLSEPSTISDRRAMLRVLRLGCMSLIAFAVTAAGWGWIIRRIGARPVVPEPFSYKLDAAMSGPRRYDTLFIGSSRFFHGLDPSIFDARTASLGLPTKSYNLGFDALSFPELRFVVEQVLARDDGRLKYLILEPSLRVRLAPGLERSQRAIILHGQSGSRELFSFILNGNHDWQHKLYWSYEHGMVTGIHVANVGALTNRYVRYQEPPPVPNELTGPGDDGFAGLDPNISLGDHVTAEGITALVDQQGRDQKQGRARSLNQFEINQLIELQQKAAEKRVAVILLAPPTASPDVFGEFAAVRAAADAGLMKVPLLSFTDPVKFYDLYRPGGFVDPDHVSAPVAKILSEHAADEFVDVMHGNGDRPERNLGAVH